MALVFGLDIGTTSIGFAAIEYDQPSATGRIIKLGARIFPEARDPDGTPLNQNRRAKRMMRRQLRRRRERRRELNEALAAAGMLPKFGSPEWKIAMALDPYALRSEGLSRALEPDELGRALYHLAKRRHFRGRDLEETEDGAATSEAADEKLTSDEAAARSERDQTIQALRATGSTLGQHIHTREAPQRKRGVHALRSHVSDEFDRLWRAQAPHHPAVLTPALRAHVEDLVFAQLPVFWRLNTLGECKLMPGAPLAPKGSWLSAQRRMLEKLNNLAFAGGNAAQLLQDERDAIKSVLQTQQSMSWGGARKALEPIFQARGQSARSLKFNLELGGEPKLLGNPVEAKLASIFGDLWQDHPQKDEIRRAVHQRLWAADYGQIGKQRVVIKRQAERLVDRKKAAQTFADDFGASPEIVSQLCDLTFPTGWDAFSTDAIEQFLPKLEDGVRLGVLLAGPEKEAWRNDTFPARVKPTGEIVDRLPSPRDPEEAARIGKMRNPTVVRTQNELRKVVNNLIDFCGRKPDLIRVELARDVGKGKKEREEISLAIKRQEKRRADAAKDLRANQIAEPSHDQIEKWLLWKECGEVDPYTGDHIDFDGLFKEARFEVEHIWPRSRSLDDSFRNKTLCRKDMNARKGNQTPWELFKNREDDWAAVKQRLQGMIAKGKAPGMSPGKVKRFLTDVIPDDFASRQLNDTGYAAREAIASLKRLWPDVGPEAPVYVEAVTGRVTAHLRKLWGLNNILGDTGEKNRADHRHHAIDALVVACAHPGVTIQLARYWKAKDDLGEGGTNKPRLDPPWASIRTDAEAAAAPVIISHRVRKKVSGALHKETIFGDTKQDIQTKTGTYREFVRRKKVESLSKGEYETIRDPKVRSIMLDWLAERGGEPKKLDWSVYPRVSPDGPEIKAVRLLVRQQLVLMAPVSTGFADLGSNHHVAIFTRPDGKAEIEIVSLFEAARRLARREPVIQREREGASFVMSLAAGDTVEFPRGHEQAGLKIVQGVWASGVVVLLNHTDATGQSVWRPAASTFPRVGVRKVSVDPIGRIRSAND